MAERNVRVLVLAFDEVYVKLTIGFNFTIMLRRCNIESLIVNYPKLNQTVSWPTYLDFSELLLQFNHSIPASFLAKLVNSLHMAQLVNHTPLAAKLSRNANRLVGRTKVGQANQFV